MTSKPNIDIPKEAAHPLSTLAFPPDIHFTDDQRGFESRLILAGYADRLADAVRGHAPIQEVKDIIGHIHRVAQSAIMHRLTVSASSERTN
jgi:hypothetical protein